MTPVPTQQQVRGRGPTALEWVAASAALALLVIGATRLWANDAASQADAPIDAAVVRALGGSTGVLAVMNPVTCALTSDDAAALNSAAAIPGVRVTVLVLALPDDDSLLARVRRDFGFSREVVLTAASRVDARSFPALLRQPFIGIVRRGQLRHISFQQSFKSLDEWLPVLVGFYPAADS